MALLLCRRPTSGPCGGVIVSHGTRNNASAARWTHRHFRLVVGTQFLQLGEIVFGDLWRVGHGRVVSRMVKRAPRTVGDQALDASEAGAFVAGRGCERLLLLMPVMMLLLLLLLLMLLTLQSKLLILRPMQGDWHVPVQHRARMPVVVWVVWLAGRVEVRQVARRGRDGLALREHRSARRSPLRYCVLDCSLACWNERPDRQQTSRGSVSPSPCCTAGKRQEPRAVPTKRRCVDGLRRRGTGVESPMPGCRPDEAQRSWSKSERLPSERCRASERQVAASRETKGRNPDSGTAARRRLFKGNAWIGRRAGPFVPNSGAGRCQRMLG